MSDSLEEIIGLAVIDPDFSDAFVQNPLEAVRAWNLPHTPTDRAVLVGQRAASLHELVAGLFVRWRELTDPAVLPLAPQARPALRSRRAEANPRRQLARHA